MFVKLGDADNRDMSAAAVTDATGFQKVRREWGHQRAKNGVQQKHQPLPVKGRKQQLGKPAVQVRPASARRLFRRLGCIIAREEDGIGKEGGGEEKRQSAER